MADSKTAFATAVLQKLGIRPSSANMQAMIGWMNAEGGHYHNDAKYNPLNTTQPEPGAGNTGTQGNIKVYKNWQQGVDATVATLKNGRYTPILHALKGSNPQAVASAIGSTPWGTSASLVASAIGGAPKGIKPGGSLAGSSTSSPAPTRTTTTTQTTTTPGVNNQPARAQAFLSYLENDRGKPDALLNLGQTLKGLQDTPSTVSVKSHDQIAQGGIAGTMAEYVQRANAFDRKNNQGKLPYQWGGGHGGKVDPTKNAIPVDCSGAVSAVLGIDPRVASQFKTFGSAGDGGNEGVTIYAKDTHVLMKINGHFFGTSGSNPGGGAGWVEQSAISPSYLKGFTARHLAKV